MITFVNPGLIDLRTLKAFGVSVKPAKENPLGQFGSGSKYALALLMRTGHKVNLYRGMDCYSFHTQKVSVRDKEFDFVYLRHPDGRDEELPFNTHTAFQWPVWQGFRELTSNALDENGSVHRGIYQPAPDQTAFTVEGAEIETAYDQRDSIFLPSKPLFESDDLEVHARQSEYVFFRGVRVNRLQQRSLYTYNLKRTVDGITEDRSLKSPNDLDFYLARLIAETTHEDFLEKVLVAPDTSFEHHLGSNWTVSPKDTFMSVYDRLRRNGEMMRLTSFANDAYKSVKRVLPLPAEVPLTKMQQMQLDRAIGFCEAAGWDVRAYPIRVIPYAHGGLIALAENGSIILTVKLFDQGVKALVSAILEEWVHLHYEYRDHTRELQTFLFDQLVSAKQEQLQQVL